MRTLLFATTNAGKIREVRGLLDGLQLELLFLTDFQEVPDVEETGATFAENAALKARGYQCLLPDGLVAAEDSGVVVPALGGEPGIYSARYGGLADDTARNALLLDRMRGLVGEDRAAHYEAVVVLLDPRGNERAFTGRVSGSIAPEPKGDGGFGYDPVFYHPESGTTFGCVTQEQKDRHSHRGKAVMALRRHLEEVL